MKLPVAIENLLCEIAQKEGFTDYKFEFESGSNRGDNYVGVVTSVKIVGDRVKDGVVTIETLNLMCKSAPKNRERRELMNIAQCFEREIYMYTRVLPTFVKFQEEKGLSPAESFMSFPKMYGWIADEANGSYVLVMEDLRSRDFVMWPRRTPVTFDHEELVFKQFGRFHGVSLALKDQRPEVFAEFKDLRDIFSDAIKTGGVLAETMDRAIDVLEKEEHKTVVRSLRNNYLETWRSFFTKEAVDRFGVIGHGDAWLNNFLFQHIGNVIYINYLFNYVLVFSILCLSTLQTKEVNDVCFLDFQFSRFASPVLDVLYHTFTSTRKPLRDESYDNLLNIYYESLSDTVRKLGSDPEKLFSFSDLQAELKTYGKFALIMGMLLLPFVLAQPNDIADLEEHAERKLKGETVSIFKTDGAKNDAYIEAVNDLVADVISYGYDF